LLRPICLSLLKDEYPYVKVRAITNFEQLAKIICLDQHVSVLLDTVLHLGENKDWRIRHAVIQCMPLFADQLGQNFFDRAVCRYCMQTLGDQVSSVYDAAVKSLKLLAVKFGVEWVVDHLLPQYLNVVNNFEGDSGQKSLGVISDILGPKLTFSKLVPMIINAPTVDRIVPEMEISVERICSLIVEECCNNL
ncbi:Serine/threonine protein phosphatase type 2A regulatory subunit A, partial [Thalictrum thalictroides]